MLQGADLFHLVGNLQHVTCVLSLGTRHLQTSQCSWRIWTWIWIWTDSQPQAPEVLEGCYAALLCYDNLSRADDKASPASEKPFPE